MRITISAKLKLNHTAAQKAALDRITLAYRDALNYASNKAFELDKTSSAPRLHKAVYADLRAQFGLGAQLACTVERQVAATYKGQWTKLKQNLKARELGRTKRRYKGLEAAPRFVARTLEYQHGRDYSWKKGGKVSVGTLEGRMVLEYEGYQKHLDLIRQGCETGAAKLYYQKSKKQYYLIVALNVELSDPHPTQHSNIVGVDVGQRYHFVATDKDGKSLFEKGKAVRQKKEHFARIKKSLQRKGTRSATRRLVALSGRERRLIADRNHTLAKRLITRFPRSIFGLEDLTKIRERTERRSNPKASPKTKRAKRHQSQWSFAELQSKLAYKAPLFGSLAVRVDAHYTSQACPKCGHVSRGNRPKAGLEFLCEACGHRGHADRVASVNIALRTMLVRQDWMSTGALSMRPDVSDGEVKAARLKRYAELRWNPDASPSLM
ncbi:RNA-guided endonuclease InsQ/TnpB family protein [Deinococcus cellulosilyticus]|uniref:Transposase n=1 Tax=Deinococcus cellulosilyticus (strain DSM 18568 / NBRC 106333 / KACC 11606 / 5516J-15) TaxID=1223518 RepID=A0A511N262_DEIC1|nr:RNA-guided endonuclease TnpB family protein [Deinococcus cellulosilyticus]GEM46942.1 transposase [Deinococcus cellulosilyticus NBRC 106333 = KACC 11606]